MTREQPATFDVEIVYQQQRDLVLIGVTLQSAETYVRRFNKVARKRGKVSRAKISRAAA
jgi:hypothetical protein